MQKDVVLVVEDSPATAKLLEIKLVEAGFNVVMSANAMDAMDKLYDFSPDLILSDVMMPEMDGFELLQKVRSETMRGDIPFIFISSKNSTEDKLRGFHLGGDDYITKPFQLDELVARIRVNIKRSERLRKESATDFLTSSLNRRAMETRLGIELQRSHRFGRTFTVGMVDIDHFKKLNDTHGHLVGDEVLRTIAGKIQAQLRDIDVVSRFGGEEFFIIMPETEKNNAFQAMERIRTSIASTNSPGADGNHISVSVSIGLAEFPGDGIDAESLIKAADMAMYQSKAAGRNKVTVYEAAPGTSLAEKNN
ncbi:MAG: diguanylate cyclase [Nitrospinae bacterium]|nr:diguanylate cyclase [Nitrospinota bacterium]